MRNKFVKIFACLLAVALTGCAEEGFPVLETSTGVTYDNANLRAIGSVAQKAQIHCQKYGKDASYVPSGIDRWYGSATFTCN